MRSQQWREGKEKNLKSTHESPDTTWCFRMSSTYICWSTDGKLESRANVLITNN